VSIRLLVVDDHHLVRGALVGLLATVPEIEVVAEAATGREALEMVRRHHPQIVLMDIEMPDLNGIEATKQIMELQPRTRVIALSVHSASHYVCQMLDAGASGFLTKSASPEELDQAIKAVSTGNKYLSPEIASSMVGAWVSGNNGAADKPAQLHPRERQVLQLLAEGNTSKQIAKTLSVSRKTVDAHRQNIMNKLKLHSVAELTKYAVRRGLTTLE
jgi:DNA-binding NarL/FixJ family response regulator